MVQTEPCWLQISRQKQFKLNFLLWNLMLQFLWFKHLKLTGENTDLTTGFWSIVCRSRLIFGHCDVNFLCHKGLQSEVTLPQSSPTSDFQAQTLSQEGYWGQNHWGRRGRVHLFIITVMFQPPVNLIKETHCSCLCSILISRGKNKLFRLLL